ncbi:uncharacterized protein LOC128206936 [Mya arenaria]|uniref:uncharacterized protein LOC128206936 n=1 Tax=Mya arenaria TaxID=6604 RepID=UPI0022E1E13A|nr:uncharacterized protein LOC128206936 [Mya arenaria]
MGSRLLNMFRSSNNSVSTKSLPLYDFKLCIFIESKHTFCYISDAENISSLRLINMFKHNFETFSKYGTERNIRVIFESFLSHLSKPTNKSSDLNRLEWTVVLPEIQSETAVLAIRSAARYMHIPETTLEVVHRSSVLLACVLEMVPTDQKYSLWKGVLLVTSDPDIKIRAYERQASYTLCEVFPEILLPFTIDSPGIQCDMRDHLMNIGDWLCVICESPLHGNDTSRVVRDFLNYIFIFDLDRTKTFQYTYGISLCKPFQEGVHREELKLNFNPEGTSSENKCVGVFQTIISKGEHLLYENQSYSWTELATFYNTRIKMKPHNLLLWKSISESRRYSSDPGCEPVARFCVYPPSEGWSDTAEFLYTLTFINNCPRVEVMDAISHQTFKTELKQLVYKSDERSFEVPLSKQTLSTDMEQLALKVDEICLEVSQSDILEAMLSFSIYPSKNYIIERRAKYAYGCFKYARPWGELHTLINIGDILRYNDDFSVSRHILHERTRNKFSVFAVWRSMVDQPRYCEEKTTKAVAEIIVDIEPKRTPCTIEWEQVLIVKSTELVYRVTNKTDGKRYETYVDY